MKEQTNNVDLKRAKINLLNLRSGEFTRKQLFLFVKNLLYPRRTLA